MARQKGTKNREEVDALSAALMAMLNAPQPLTPTCTISKSKFVAGVQCLKRLYLLQREPQLAVVSDQARAVMEEGTRIGVLARSAFPGGVLVESDHKHLAEAIRITGELLNNREVPAIFEGTFEYEGVLVRVDVLDRKDCGFRLIEVKSSTGVKPHYAYDVGIQYHVLLGAGAQVDGTCLMHLNRDYVFDGRSEAGANRYDLSRLFTIADVQPASRGETTRLLNDQFRVLSHNQPPDVTTGRHCLDPVECEFYGFCHPALPEDHVGRLPIRSEKIDQLLSRKITCVSQISSPLALFSLSPKERTRVDAVKTGRTWVHQHLVNELAAICYPLCFVDFETIFPAFPSYAGMRPYDHIPFQWSVHRLQHSNAPLEHLAFLAEGSADPRHAFLASLCEAVKHANCVVVYGAFEMTRLKELAAHFPKYAAEIAEICTKLRDLLGVVRRNIYHPAFDGSYSLKRVLPALVPEVSYQGMEVANGLEAGAAWLKMLDPVTCSDERDRLKTALLGYCGKDTFALVCILDVLTRISFLNDNPESSDRLNRQCL